MKLYDIHTHRACSESNNVIINVSPFEFKQYETEEAPYKQYFFSCGIHPNYLTGIDTQMAYLEKIADNPHIVAIGETGLDKLSDFSLDTQLSAFKTHIKLSEKFNKPLIIHCVKAWNELIYIRRATNPQQSWIIHGYRGKPELTKQLVKEGFLFSVGAAINADSIPIIPIDSLFCETDESEKSICDVYRKVADVMCVDIKTLTISVAKNVGRVFPELVVEKSF